MSQHSHSHADGVNHNHDHHDHHQHQQEEEEQSEQFHLVKVISAFAYYKRHSLTHNHRRRRDYHSLPEHHKQLIPDYLIKIDKVDSCIEENMILLRDIVQSSSMFLDGQPPVTNTTTDQPVFSPMDMDKVKSTLKQFVRDWSKEVYDNYLHK
jgi:carnosine N-methyltransferase